MLDLRKILVIISGVAAAVTMLLTIGNLGKTAGSSTGAPGVSIHYLQVVVSSQGFSETIFFKIVSTETQKRAFVDGFTKGISKTGTITSQVDDIAGLPTNALYVCQINMQSGSGDSIQVYAVSGDALSRDIAQGGCDGGNAAG